MIYYCADLSAPAWSLGYSKELSGTLQCLRLVSLAMVFVPNIFCYPDVASINLNLVIVAFYIDYTIIMIVKIKNKRSIPANGWMTFHVGKRQTHELSLTKLDAIVEVSLQFWE